MRQNTPDVARPSRLRRAATRRVERPPRSAAGTRTAPLCRCRPGRGSSFSSSPAGNGRPGRRRGRRSSPRRMSVVARVVTASEELHARLDRLACEPETTASGGIARSGGSPYPIPWWNGSAVDTTTASLHQLGELSMPGSLVRLATCEIRIALDDLGSDDSPPLRLGLPEVAKPMSEWPSRHLAPLDARP